MSCHFVPFGCRFYNIYLLGLGLALPSKASSSQAGEEAEANIPGLTEKDFEPLQESAPSTANDDTTRATEQQEVSAAAGLAAAAVAGGLAALSIPESGSISPHATGGHEDSARSPAPSLAADAGRMAVVAPLASPSALKSSSAAAPSSPSAQQPDEKLNKFVDFLSNDNPGACMFQAQMRLSLEGCRKLSNFVGSNERVKALSLSHNRIGGLGAL